MLVEGGNVLRDELLEMQALLSACDSSDADLPLVQRHDQFGGYDSRRHPAHLDIAPPNVPYTTRHTDNRCTARLLETFTVPLDMKIKQ
jgi:hypothetical protein